jgi:polyphosphate kinase 2 (PPK2 family)
MKKNKLTQYIKSIRIDGSSRVSISKLSTSYSPEKIDKSEAEELIKMSINELANLQDKLYAHDKYSILIVFQGMDAAGKDGAIRHVMSGLNPQGVKVASFKSPSSQELDHDFFGDIIYNYLLEVKLAYSIVRITKTF